MLENLNVKYGELRYSDMLLITDTGDTLNPVESEMSLSFKELEIITKERVKEGFNVFFFLNLPLN